MKYVMNINENNEMSLFEMISNPFDWIFKLKVLLLLSLLKLWNKSKSK